VGGTVTRRIPGYDITDYDEDDDMLQFVPMLGDKVRVRTPSGEHGTVLDVDYSYGLVRVELPWPWYRYPKKRKRTAVYRVKDLEIEA